MPITPDLKPTEFEITDLCPIADCRVQTTFAFSRELLKSPKDLAEVKRLLVDSQVKAHKEGKHNG